MSTLADFINSSGSLESQVEAQGAVLAVMPNRNRIINGKMDIAQRGSSFPAAVGYTLDRFVYESSTTGIVTVSQQAEAPAGFVNSLRATVTAADTSIAAGEYAVLRQSIEGYNVADLVGKTFTVSFFVRSSKTGVHCLYFRNADNTMSYVSEYVVNQSNTWEYKTVTVAGGLPNTGSWNFTNGAGLIVRWALANGSGSFTASPGSWLSGSFATTANQVNCLDTVGNIFAITGVQLEVGEEATPFEHRLYGQELALCERYCQFIPATAWLPFSADGPANGYASILLRGKMRSTPIWSALGAFTARAPNGTTIPCSLSSNTAADSSIFVSVNFASNAAFGIGAACLMSGSGILVTSEL